MATVPVLRKPQAIYRRYGLHLHVTENLLPAVFALPAGYGDIFIGATAGLVAWKLAAPHHRASFIVWQLLGMLDLVTAVSTDDDV